MALRRRWLLGLVVANVAATILHYGDNILRFARYPEPAWMAPHLIDAFWFLMTPFAVIGYVLTGRGRVHAGSMALYAYAAMSLLVLGHYRYAPFRDISFGIHALILLEAGLALALAAFVLVLQVRGGRALVRA